MPTRLAASDRDRSRHALDLDTSASGVYAWLQAHAGAYNFERTVPSEIWHWEHG